MSSVCTLLHYLHCLYMHVRCPQALWYLCGDSILNQFAFSNHSFVTNSTFPSSSFVRKWVHWWIHIWHIHGLDQRGVRSRDTNNLQQHFLILNHWWCVLFIILYLFFFFFFYISPVILVSSLLSRNALQHRYVLKGDDWVRISTSNKI